MMKKIFFIFLFFNKMLPLSLEDKRLCEGVKSKDAKVVEEALKNGANANLIIHYANNYFGEYNVPLVCHIIWTARSATNFYDNSDNTNILKILKLLMKHGANINTKDSSNYTALHHASFLGDRDIAKTLLDAKANVNFVGTSPLHCATSYCRSYEVVKLLLNSKADLCNFSDVTPLHSACYNKSYRAYQIAVALIARGSDVNAVSINNDTPLEIIKKNKNKFRKALMLNAILQRRQTMITVVTKMLSKNQVFLAEPLIRLIMTYLLM